jgi:hypothetical protein
MSGRGGRRIHLPNLANVIRRLQKSAKCILELLVAAEAFRDLFVDEHGPSSSSSQASSVGLDGALKPLGAQLGNFELIVLDVRHTRSLREA